MVMTKEKIDAKIAAAKGGKKNSGAKKGNGDAKVDAEITRLAALNPVQYEQERKAAAEKLNLRASILDKLVKAERPDDDNKQGGAISFPEPEPWPEPINGALLLDDISNAICGYVVMSSAARDTTALWSLHTYQLDQSLVTPRLAITSPEKRCGKTTLLDVLSRLVLKPLPTANVTPAAIFRVVEGHRPSLLIDEADTFLKGKNASDELRGVVNSGHRKGGSVLRTVGDDHEPRSFSTYAACAIALIGRLPETLHDRSVIVSLKRRLPTEEIASFRPDRAGHLDELARKAARWAADNAERIGDADPEMPAGVFNREADNWRPLLAIADAAGDDWPERARDALQAAHTADDDESRLAMLLADIKAEFAARNTDQLSSASLVAALVEIEGRPWAEYGKKGKPLTPNQLARALKPLGIAPENIRVGDKVPKGYLLARFEEAFARYLDEGGFEPLHRYNADDTGTSEGFQTATPETDVAVRKCEKANNDGHCSGVAVEKGGISEETRVCEHCGASDRSGDPVQEVWIVGEQHLLHRGCQNMPIGSRTLGVAPGQRCELCGEGRDVHLVCLPGEPEAAPRHKQCAARYWEHLGTS
jgi:putative DNA primase/helicase